MPTITSPFRYTYSDMRVLMANAHAYGPCKILIFRIHSFTHGRASLKIPNLGRACRDRRQVGIIWVRWASVTLIASHESNFTAPDTFREIKIYGNYKKHTQTAKNDSDKTVYIIVKIFILPLPFLICEPARNRGVHMKGGLGGQCNTCSSHSLV